jgi:ParB-like chromosome segregation protein Spo0J
MMTVSLPTTAIFTRKDARKVDDASVASLVSSIREIGIINPLRVRLACHVEEGGVEAYEVIAGSHRLRAARKLGLESVPCVVVDDDDLRAELAMIDENLCRAELSPADRAAQTARRKAIYLELHPETAHGGDRRSDQVADFATRSFVSETAGTSGKAERTVRLDAERGEKVCEEALNLVRGTALDTGSYLDKLKRVDPSEQVETVQRALSGLARQLERDRAEALASRNKSRVEADVKARAAQEVAEILAEHVPGDLWDGLKANLYAAGATNVASALTNLVGQAVMDRSAA